MVKKKRKGLYGSDYVFCANCGKRIDWQDYSRETGWGVLCEKCAYKGGLIED